MAPPFARWQKAKVLVITRRPISGMYVEVDKDHFLGFAGLKDDMRAIDESEDGESKILVYSSCTV